MAQKIKIFFYSLIKKVILDEKAVFLMKFFRLVFSCNFKLYHKIGNSVCDKL